MRSTVTLPLAQLNSAHLVLAEGDGLAWQEAGADYVGFRRILQKIQEGGSISM
jgi:hypothetical protein